MAPTKRRIVDAEVIPWEGDLYGVRLTFNEGPPASVLVGSKEDAEVTAIVAIGQGDEFLAMLRDMAGGA